MPVSDFKLRDTLRESSAGREIPDFVIEGGKGGRFDATLAEQYALKCSTLSKTVSLRKEGPRLLAQLKATRSVPKGERVRYNKFLVTTLRTVEGFVECSRPGAIADSGKRKDVFSRYAAFLNFVEVQGGRRFSLLGLDPGLSSPCPSYSPSTSLATQSEGKDEKEKGKDKDKGHSGSMARSVSGLAEDRHSLYQAKYQQYREDFGLDEDVSGSEPDQGFPDADVDRDLEVQDDDMRGVKESTWRFG
ncbi:hypothetical protein BDW68DRAFT_194398 [Aspergillus falconensis]